MLFRSHLDLIDLQAVVRPLSVRLAGMTDPAARRLADAILEVVRAELTRRSGEALEAPGRRGPFRA